MRFRYVNGICEEIRAVQVEIHNGEIVRARFNGSANIIDVRDIKNSLKYMKEEWLGGKGVLREGVFWTAFITYIFPWFLDVAKVYCCVKVCQAFLQERNGSVGDGKTGMQSLVHYGKWYLIFTLIPWCVELVDQIGHKMSIELSHQKLPDSSTLGHYK
jgi:hypothetical protein